jgi:formate hydrogenlyase subunit 6/NADH:ubiquinone oxidoreductase subunit I
MTIAESGVKGFWSPILIPRIGYCDYSCNACGQVCPVEAIPPLALDQKREQVIGRAFLDKTRCLPWSEDTHCVVCEEMCPIPEKAIRLKEDQIISAESDSESLLKPIVVRKLCIGCGICENKCPVEGPAAIQVHRHQGRRYGHGLT